jgi:copper transport protein
VVGGNQTGKSDDHHGMECDTVREALSARLDGEDTGLPEGPVDHHLEGCRACRAWSEELATLPRMVRVREAEAVPDLSAAIVAAHQPGPPPPRGAGLARRLPALGEAISGARWALFIVALTKLVLAAPALLGQDPGATVHVAREIGSFDIALAVGLLVAACQPARAWGLLPLAASLAAVMAATAVLDVADGRISTVGEAHHLLDLAGVALLWMVAREARPTTRRGRATLPPSSAPVLRHRGAPSRRRARGPVALAALVLGLLLATAGPASAHATLIAADPPDGARLDHSPAQVHLTFNEHVSASLGGIRVVDGTGRRADRGAVEVTGPAVTVALAPDLADGTYVATYRVISADGHPVRGSIVFAVGSAAVDQSVARRARSGGNDSTWDVVGDVGRGFAYGGVLLAAGGVLFLVLAHREGEERRTLRRLLWSGAALGAAGSLVTLPVQAALGTGKGPGALFESGVLGAVTDDGVGLALGLCLVGLLVAVVFLERRRWVAVAGAAVAAASFAATGHTRVGDLAVLATVADAVHLLVVAVWGGGVAFLAVALMARHRQDPGPETTDTAALVLRFSSLATVTVIGAGITGGFLGWEEVRSWHGLTSTTYGQLLLAKAAAVAVVAALGAYNHVRLLPALQQGKAKAALARLRTTVRIEALVLAGVVGLTSVLVLKTPARTVEAGGPVEKVVQLSQGAGSVQIVVAPAKVGYDQLHVYTFDPEGRPTELADTIDLELSLPAADLGPIQRTATRAGPAHAQLNGNDFAVAGTWRITVRLQLDKFTEVTGSTDIKIAR